MAPNRLTLTINNPTPFYLRFHSLFTWHGRCTSTPSDVPPDTVIKSRWVAKRGSLTGVAGCVAYEVRARGYGGVLLVVGFTNSWWRGRRV